MNAYNRPDVSVSEEHRDGRDIGDGIFTRIQYR